ncbi:MAG: DUF2318 domain-containing protein [Pseudomonadota bacterium]
MERLIRGCLSVLVVSLLLLIASGSQAFLGAKFTPLTPKEGKVSIPVNTIDDGKAHYYKTKADDGTMVDFFVVKSSDGVIRAAIDSCDVCYRSGKGYVQDGDVMVCTNCGRRFATDRINEVKGGCNPAPLTRIMEGENLVVSMTDINANAWYCKFK